MSRCPFTSHFDNPLRGVRFGKDILTHNFSKEHNGNMLTFYRIIVIIMKFASTRSQYGNLRSKKYGFGKIQKI